MVLLTLYLETWILIQQLNIISEMVNILELFSFPIILFILVDRLPKVFPLADCREGYNTGLTVGSDNTTVSIEYLDIADPVSISNVHSSQLWCIHKKSEDCPCGGNQTRNHIELNEKGKVRHMGTCKYLKAEPPTEYNNGSVTVTVSKILVF